MKNIEEIVKDLHEINFGANGIIRPTRGGADYDYDTWKKNKKKHCYKSAYYCDMCDAILNNKNGDNFPLTNISHGTHTYDFIMAHNKNEEDRKKKFNETESWPKAPVIFVMENPGALSGNDYIETGKGKKKAIESWYWLDGDMDSDENYIYPNYFKQGEYGRLVYSIINTFKISNGYLTNMVKCGAGRYNGTKYEYANTEEYRDDIIDNCIKTQLHTEINAMRGGCDDNKVIIFAFGQRTYSKLKTVFANDKYSIYLLPHPASRLANDYRKHVLFSKILHGLLNSEFYDRPGDEMIRFADIIKRCNDDANETEPDIRTLLEETGIQKRKTYKENCLGYELGYSDKSGDTIEYLTFRHMKTESTADHVSWARYNFARKEICLYIGKKKKADKFIDEGHDNYKAYIELTKFLEEKLGIKDYSTCMSEEEK